MKLLFSATSFAVAVSAGITTIVGMDFVSFGLAFQPYPQRMTSMAGSSGSGSGSGSGSSRISTTTLFQADEIKEYRKGLSKINRAKSSKRVREKKKKK